MSDTPDQATTDQASSGPADAAATGWNAATLDSPTGAVLRYYTAFATGNARGVVHINHGMGEHAGRYGRFAAALAARGYHVYAHDHRGHGHTTAPDAPLGHFADRNGWQLVLQDVSAMQALIRTAHPGLPLASFGHSMGSIIAFNHALEHGGGAGGDLAALACWNADFRAGLLAKLGKAILRSERLFKGPRAISNITRKLTFDDWNRKFRPNRTAFDWLSADTGEVDKYVADPLCGFPITVGLWQDVLQGVTRAAEDTALAALPKSLPVHLQGGGQDPCTEQGKGVAHTAARLRSAGMQDVTLEILPEARHESLNELGRDTITANFIDWLDARL